MARSHPLWRGFWLALSMAAVLFLLGPTDPLSPFRLERKPMVFFAAMTAGAFIAALPGRLRRRGKSAWRAPWQQPRWGLRLLRAFLCGAAMALALGMAGSGAVIPALMTGSVGAYAFCGMALIAGFITLRIAERRRKS